MAHTLIPSISPPLRLGARRRGQAKGRYVSYQLKTIEDLKPAPYNPREITLDAAKGLSVSLAQFGDISGIVWNKQSGHLVAGHQRLEALKAHGATFEGGNTPCLMVGSETYLVRIVDWDMQTEQAANVTANNPHIAGAFTDELQDVLGSLRDEFPEFEELRLCDLDLDGEIIERDGDATSGQSHWDHLQGEGDPRPCFRVGNIYAKVSEDAAQKLDDIIEGLGENWRDEIEEVIKTWALRL